ncbi:MAG: hypothetical protein DBW83_05820 [Synechococcus sp. MED-G69]|nr:MAG: hypothetical protein DBW83_05820 [Synechococcus sp. MED-G69]
MEAARMCKDFLTKKQKKASFSATLQIQARKSKHLGLTNIPLFPKNGLIWRNPSKRKFITTRMDLYSIDTSM